jgi:hypothetical protein
VGLLWRERIGDISRFVTKATRTLLRVITIIGGTVAVMFFTRQIAYIVGGPQSGLVSLLVFAVSLALSFLIVFSVVGFIDKTLDRKVKK